jgi:Zn-dependent M28 family amino/carboxypeptidase
MKAVIASLACITLASCMLAPRRGADDLEAALSSIDADAMLAHIRILASDEFEGRRPGTRGEQLTVAYLTDQFKRLGLQPANPDGTYVQKVPFIASRAHGELSFRVRDQQIALKEPADFRSLPVWQTPDIRIDDSELVFVGYGVVASEYDWDDYKGIDLTGKTVVVLPNDPQLPDPRDPTKLDEAMFKGRAVTSYARLEHKRSEARRHGAVAILTLFEPGLFGTPDWKDRISTAGIETFDTREEDQRRGEVSASAELSPEAAQRLFAACGLDLAALKKAALRKDFRPVAMNARASLSVTQVTREVESQNVVARVEGSDPKLRHEVVIYTAHWDHFGRTETPQGAQIFSGARDNAAGVAAMLEVAKAFARLATPPKRSVMFIATTGEEQGLLGAKYYAAHPLVPLQRTLAALNIDIVNVLGPTRDIAVIGIDKSTLGDMLASLAQQQGRVATGDLLPELGLFYRADHKEFASAGVPSLWMRRGLDVIGKPPDFGRNDTAAYLANDYHKVTDKVRPDWNLSGAVEDYRLYARLGYAVAQAAQSPEWKPGDEFRPRAKQC